MNYCHRRILHGRGLIKIPIGGHFYGVSSGSGWGGLPTRVQKKQKSLGMYSTAGFTIFSYIVALVQKCLYVHLNEFLHTAMIPFVGAKPTHSPQLVF
jgi:hypothetical protein